MEWTKEQAGEKWCPFVRVSTGNTFTQTNRTVPSKCLADGCMAWEDGIVGYGSCLLLKEASNG